MIFTITRSAKTAENPFKIKGKVTAISAIATAFKWRDDAMRGGKNGREAQKNAA
ncbi:hypothetical protein QL200_04750 [Cronobacter dublinensis]|uniref:hypothetical protein n=1 Tax=Cronobacter dublinensis TaxID=413497 RepID=UPI0003AAA9C2|nr:hypothetical protein [Cronobacter dublinensis]MDI6425249.1 hypothetical protein [Cronobacter dublinensis]